MGSLFSNVKKMIVDMEGTKDIDDKNDHGGETKYGISQRQYPDIKISELSEEDAFNILEKEYWNKYNLSTIDNQAIANQVFFLLINMNPLTAIKILQIAVNACYNGRSIKIDGLLGLETINCINLLATGSKWLSNRIRIESISYYLHLTDIDKTQIEFFRGWVRRALK